MTNALFVDYQPRFNPGHSHVIKGGMSLFDSSHSKFKRFGALIGASPAMQNLYKMIEKVAPTDATVLLIGESGTGKELVAHTLHQLSRRQKQPCLPVNCGAIPANLIESELFGYERGSFTGANRTHKGYFERASGGTIFLDEITEMPIEMQVKLLRVLETGRIVRIGGDQEIRVDVRVVAATNRSPQEAVADGKLREDLLYRLSVFPLAVPPLRDRGDDVELLAQFFLAELNEAEGTSRYFSDTALERIENYNWPGNVRELKNVVQRAYILADEKVELDSLVPSAKSTVDITGHYLRVSVGTPLADAERHLIFATLEYYGGNKKKTAEVLGLSLKTLYNRLNSYNV